MKTFEEYQVAALATASYPHLRQNLAYPALGLAGEAGEAADKIKKLWRNKDLPHPPGFDDTDPQWRTELIKELGDVLWYIAALAFELRVPLEEIANQNIAKLLDRKNRGTIKSEGDNR